MDVLDGKKVFDLINLELCICSLWIWIRKKIYLVLSSRLSNIVCSLCCFKLFILWEIGKVYLLFEGEGFFMKNEYECVCVYSV